MATFLASAALGRPSDLRLFKDEVPWTLSEPVCLLAYPQRSIALLRVDHYEVQLVS